MPITSHREDQERTFWASELSALEVDPPHVPSTCDRCNQRHSVRPPRKSSSPIAFDRTKSISKRNRQRSCENIRSGLHRNVGVLELLHLIHLWVRKKREERGQGVGKRNDEMNGQTQFSIRISTEEQSRAYCWEP